MKIHLAAAAAIAVLALAGCNRPREVVVEHDKVIIEHDQPAVSHDDRDRDHHDADAADRPAGDHPDEGRRPDGARPDGGDYAGHRDGPPSAPDRRP